MKSNKKVLFISHDATHTGAPILLLSILKWIKVNDVFDFEVLLLKGGDLKPEFEKLSKVYLFAPAKTSIFKRRFNRLLNRRIDNDKEIYHAFFKNNAEKYSTIYGNTVLTVSAFENLYRLFPKAKFILHVHEMFSYTKNYKRELEIANKMSVQFIAASELVQKNLNENHAINSKIELIQSFIDVDTVKSTKLINNIELDKKFQINSSGYVEPRKGYDIFILIAKRAIQKYTDIPFLFKWIGVLPENLLTYIDLDIELGGLKNNLEFTGQLENPYGTYSEADVFLLTSREEPFSMVALEHACFGIPIMCFEKTAGVIEFVEQGAGIILPYLDIEKTVDTLAELYYDAERRKEMGEFAANNVDKYHVKNQVPKIVNLINKFSN